MDSALNKLKDFALSFWDYEKPPNPVTWCEENLVLTSRVTATPGPYSTSYTPYVREPLGCFGNNRIHSIIFCFGSQTAKTTTISAGTCYFIANDPCPALFVMPTESLARSFSETRLQPFLLSSEQIKELVPKDKDKFKLLEMHFLNCTLNLVGSNSPANIASRPIRLLCMDEIDKFAPATSKEAASLELARERTKSFPNKKEVLTSTPTTEQGDIWQEFLAGDQRYYFVPCPHCNKTFTFDFKSVKWASEAKNQATGKWNLKEVGTTAHYECPHCKGKITDSHKPRMLKAGEWRATNTHAEPGRRSYHLNSLYSPSVTFAQAAIKFLKAKESVNGLQNFQNSWLSLPWITDDEMPRALEGDGYRKAEFWDGQKVEDEIYRFLTVDKQQDHFWAVARAWKPDDSSQLLWESKISTWDQIREVQLRLKVKDRCVLIDSGYDTAQVYKHCAMYGWTATKGEGSQNYQHYSDGSKESVKKFYSKPQKVLTGNSSCRLVLFCDEKLKDVLSWLRRGEGPAWRVPDDLSENYHKQIDTEVKREIMNKVTGQSQWKWIRIKRDNHLWDCEKMQVLAALMCKLLGKCYND